MLRIAALALALLVPATLRAQTPPADPFAGLRFLMGHWVDVPKDKPDGSSGQFTLQPDLDGKILVRWNEAVVVRPGEKPAKHNDLMIIYEENGRARAHYYDNEGHVIQYDVTADGKKATFESAQAPKAPRFRLTYEQEKDGEVAVTFAMAAPGKDFVPYLSGRVRKS
jgi:hypothetical protein